MLTYRSASLHEPQSAATSRRRSLSHGPGCAGLSRSRKCLVHGDTPDDEWARRGHLYCEGSHVFSENFRSDRMAAQWLTPRSRDTHPGRWKIRQLVTEALRHAPYSSRLN
ncbi:hypothetical protein DPEC_G00067790 [Dallia pectoralis]|uniref:Uncharacterized protein n=1 Tax=Dallia pectoralis TaxID=75939 RepID=A0ACC2H1I1_DALPE|nr:hypothetical protein DPEC_G00067790 [Dallia pectoralis]